MSNKSLAILIFSLGLVIAQYNDNADPEITRVQTLRQEERNLASPDEKTKTIYAVNILPIPYGRRGDGVDNEVNQNNQHNTPGGSVSALFFLQKINDDGHLPDGIYYRPAADEKESPPPVFQKDITNLQAFALASGLGGGVQKSRESN